MRVGTARFTLVVRSAAGEEREYELARARTIIGRLARCDLMVALPIVADQHCEVVLDEEGLVVTDLDTEHGTVINGERVKTARLRNGDTIALGPMQFFVRDRHHAAGGDADDTLQAEIQRELSPEIETMPPGMKSMQV